MKVNTLQSLVLCHYSTTAPAITALNRSATARVITGAGAAAKAARVYNTVISSRGTAVGKAVSLQQRVGVNLRKLGLPLKIGGFYLPIRRIADAQNIFDDGLCELDDVREDILATYPSLVGEVTTQLGSFATEVVIPTATDIAARFTMTMTILNQPVPVGELEGVVSEIANRVRADSQRQAHAMLRDAHSGPVADLKKQLTEFIDALRNAQRLHLSQFDKLREEAARVRGLNVLDLPEIDEVVRLASEVSSMGVDGMDQAERNRIAEKAAKASTLADDTLAALGL